MATKPKKQWPAHVVETDGVFFPAEVCVGLHSLSNHSSVKGARLAAAGYNDFWMKSGAAHLHLLAKYHLCTTEKEADRVLKAMGWDGKQFPSQFVRTFTEKVLAALEPKP